MTSDIFFTKEADLHKWKLMEIANTPHTHTHKWTKHGNQIQVVFCFVLVMMVDGQNENEKK